jgi:hypothetical protein
MEKIGILHENKNVACYVPITNLSKSAIRDMGIF